MNEVIKKRKKENEHFLINRIFYDKDLDKIIVDQCD